MARFLFETSNYQGAPQQGAPQEGAPQGIGFRTVEIFSLARTALFPADSEPGGFINGKGFAIGGGWTSGASCQPCA
jgi:hypothetical protein